MFVIRQTMGCICGKETVSIENQNYSVRSRLGEGGFSFVDLVENSRTKKCYALKRINCHSRDDKEKFMKEVEYMRKFGQHPNIISLEGCEQVTINNPASSVVSRILILMPYYSGGTIQDVLDSREYINQSDLLRLLIDVCNAVHTLHSHEPSIAHRDIKPANVLVTEDGRAILMDLGSADMAVCSVNNARDGQRIQDDAAERCTMPYRAPELFHVQTGDHITQATDIWSLGCLIYACIYLQGPFDDVYKKGGSIALAAVGGNVEFPDQLKYVYKLVELTKLMLNVAPDQRPNITTVIEKLESIQNRVENRV